MDQHAHQPAAPQTGSAESDVDCSAAKCVVRLRRVAAVAGGLLVVLTWRLWIPQTVYPQVPLIAIATHWPAWIGWPIAFVAGGVLLSCGLLHGEKPARFLSMALALLFALLVVVDQHRLQPWAYQIALVLLALGCCRPERGLRLARWLTISLYFYSAISKLDYTFLHGLGQQFLTSLLHAVGGSIESWPADTRVLGALLFPAGEAAVALSLCLRHTRGVAAIASIGMHVLLMVILGPWGLHHQPPVLIWNAYFIAQNWLLFWRTGRLALVDPAKQPISRRSRLSEAFATAVVVVVLALPALAPLEWFDQWPAWAVYAPAGRKLGVFIRATATDKLPNRLQPYLAPSSDDEWQELKIDRWSLDTLGAPIYPQVRFQIGVAEYVARRFALDNDVQVVVASPASRMMGVRTEETLIGTEEISAAANAFSLNAHPRP